MSSQVSECSPHTCPGHLSPVPILYLARLGAGPAATVASPALRAAWCRVPISFPGQLPFLCDGFRIWPPLLLFHGMWPNEITTFSLWPTNFRATAGGYFSLDVKVIVPHCSHPGTPASRLTGLSVSVSVAARCIVSSHVEHGALSGQDLILGTC